MLNSKKIFWIFHGGIIALSLIAQHNALAETILVLAALIHTTCLAAMATIIWRYEGGKPNPDHLDIRNGFPVSGDSAGIATFLGLVAMLYAGFYLVAVLWIIQLWPYLYLTEVSEWQQVFKRRMEWADRDVVSDAEILNETVHENE